MPLLAKLLLCAVFRIFLLDIATPTVARSWGGRTTRFIDAGATLAVVGRHGHRRLLCIVDGVMMAVVGSQGSDSLLYYCVVGCGCRWKRWDWAADWVIAGKGREELWNQDSVIESWSLLLTICWACIREAGTGFIIGLLTPTRLTPVRPVLKPSWAPATFRTAAPPSAVAARSFQS